MDVGPGTSLAIVASSALAAILAALAAGLGVLVAVVVLELLLGIVLGPRGSMGCTSAFSALRFAPRH